MIHVELIGTRPILFDAYPGTKETKVPPERKLYFHQDGETLVIPAINIYSMLASQNTLSAARILEPKNYRQLANRILSSLYIKEQEIVLVDEQKKPIKFSGFDGIRFDIRRDIARVKKGSLCIPKETERPMLKLPWQADFHILVLDNSGYILDFETIRTLFEIAGRQIGLGTFRPIFGLFEPKLEIVG